MGVIQRQTIKGTLYSYLGVGLGFINLVILSPKIFSSDQIGVIQVLVAMAVILAQFASLGFNNVSIKMFPLFRDEKKKHHGYLGLGFIISLIGFALFSILILLGKPIFIQQNADKSSLLPEYIDWIIPLVFLFLYYNLLDTYARVMYKAALGSFLREVLIRIINLCLIISVYTGWIDFRTYVILYILSYSITIFILGAYLILTGHVSFKIDFTILNKLRSEMLTVALFGLIAGLSGVAKLSFDKLMINSFLDLSAAGVYSVAFYFGTLILIPQRAMSKISSTVISEAWKENDRDLISRTYYQSSINQFVVGALVFLLVWLNVDSMLSYLPEIYSQGKYVIFFIALANLIEVMAGVNIQIIITSEYYRYQTYFMILLLVCIVLTNIILIPVLGINGAAIATLISSVIYTAARILFLYRRYSFQPFRINHIKVLLIIATLILLGMITPHFSNWIIDIIIRSFAISSIYILLSLILRTSDELVKILHLLINKGFGR